jgi:hypothetical protein
MELRLFGYCGEESSGGNLLNRARYAYDPAGLVVGFARQSLGVPEMLTQGVASLVSGVNLLHPRPPHPAPGNGSHGPGNGATHPQENRSGEGEGREP